MLYTHFLPSVYVYTQIRVQAHGWFAHTQHSLTHTEREREREREVSALVQNSLVYMMHTMMKYTKNMAIIILYCNLVH